MRKMSDIVSNQDPVTLRPNATVREACQCMRDPRVGAILVTEGDRRLLSIFTGRDAVHRVLADGKSAARTKLAEVMTRDPTTIPPGRTAIEALRLMHNGRYQRRQRGGHCFTLRLQRYRARSPRRGDRPLGVALTAHVSAECPFANEARVPAIPARWSSSAASLRNGGRFRPSKYGARAA